MHQGGERLRFCILFNASEPEQAGGRTCIAPDGRQLLLQGLGKSDAVLPQIRVLGAAPGLIVGHQRFGWFAVRALRGHPSVAFGFEPTRLDALQHEHSRVAEGAW